MSLSFTVSVTDTTGAYGAYTSLIQTDVIYAGFVWASSINSNASIEVQVNIAQTPSDTANGTAATSTFLSSSNGLDYWRFGTISEMITGQDPNGAAADVIINVDPDYINQWLWFDPNPSPNSVVPANKLNAVEAFEHELGHAFGFNGFLNWSTGLPTQNDYSTFDTYVTVINGVPYFTGPAAEAVYGGAVPLTIGNLYHVGNSAGQPGSDLLGDLMNGVIGFLGNGPGVSALDLAILKDIGVPMLAPTAGTETRHDFNGDGNSDIVWRNDAGATSIWAMNDATILHSSSLGTMPAAWTLAGTGDFNGDGMSDLLWRNEAAGTAQIWDMNDGAILHANSLGIIPSNWHALGVGDFNGDGMSDIVWRNDAGATSIWAMNDGVIDHSNTLGTVPSTWTLAGTGDFNGDGNSDLLWRNEAAGTAQIWDMNDGAILHANSLGVIPSNWHILGVGDFNGDNMSDIVWRNGAGTTQIWDMNDGAILHTNSLGVIPANWQLEGTGDYNGDGKSDLLWRNETASAAQIWDMNDGTVLHANSLGVIPANWHIIA
ncbi:VCBS repeat-containing protein [Bradyrhizobium lablabi]|uniref:FG-GAP repeat domain-containing protein n=1 Tax=Bradyrhizobium lablabi TaxID=722472 RepID=UPI001BAD2E2E|nr:VCBS repeat-containing protein [Bradyrhizobium lablabi]MBR1123330.1 VCBS repeat-containing protein [Bradyrhizobium lablabi]